MARGSVLSIAGTALAVAVLGACAPEPVAETEPRPATPPTSQVLDPGRRPPVPPTLGFDRVKRDADGEWGVRHVTDR